MSVKIKGNQWCDRCQRPVAAVKSTNRVRNTGAVTAGLLTGRLGFLAAKNDAYVCQTCGGPTRRLPRPSAPARPVLTKLAPAPPTVVCPACGVTNAPARRCHRCAADLPAA